MHTSCVPQAPAATNPKRPLVDSLLDVSVREGSQQEIDLLHADIHTKIEVALQSVRIGVKQIEVTAFAPGSWFSDADQLSLTTSAQIPDDVLLRALYFNNRGLHQLLTHPRIAREGIFHTAATSRYRTINYGQPSIENTLSRMEGFIAAFKEQGLSFDTLCVSTVWGEQEEPVSVSAVVDFIRTLRELADSRGLPIRSVALADTVANATPETIDRLIRAIRCDWPGVILRAHLHPPHELARECVEAAFEAGVDEWEASWGGMGGSPNATPAGGNLDIRWLVRVYQDHHLEHGLCLEEIPRMIHYLERVTQREIVKIAL